MTSTVSKDQESFNNIINALTDGKRIVYDKNQHKFVAKTRSEAKEGKKDCVSDLDKLQPEILKLISTLNLSLPDLKRLSEALKKRAEKNETSWFEAKKIGARNLYAIRGGIEVLIILKNNSAVLASTPGPQNSTTVTQVTASSVTTSSSPPQKPVPPLPGKKPTEEDEIFATSSSSSTSSVAAPPAPPPPPPFGGPPPPPPPGIGAPPPPPSLTGNAGPSRAHQDLIKARKKVKDEQNQPRLPAGVDIGKPETLKKLSNDQKLALQKEIDVYLNGSEITSKLSSKRTQNGLSSCIEKIEARKKAHSAAKMKLEAPQKELERLESEKKSMEKRLAKMQETQTKGESFFLYTTQRDKESGTITKKVPIRYYSEKEMREIRRAFATVSSADQTDLQAKLAKEKGHTRANEELIPEDRSLATLIAEQQKLIKQKEIEIKDRKETIGLFQKEVETIETEENGEVPFADYKSYVDDRKQLRSKYEAVLRTMGNVEEKTEKGLKEQKDEHLENVISNLPYVDEEREMFANLGTQRTLVSNLSSILSSSEVMTEDEINSGSRS